ncbi:Signal transduction histidine kinase [Treponema bryantii]|uniref:histidine kinase n=1 Tax=Treponema bryantii TaxID=163 RepID=A0A1H9IUJ4_9SPIR|nr:hybrid sensor histidine kinase/response regulator [Treponema bryantii]SEQ78182.1 Signal transduction histidine kinase [Treponema bryantii]
MREKSSNLLKNQTVILILSSIALTFLVTALILIAQSHTLLLKNYTNAIYLESEKKSLELNYFFNTAEDIVAGWKKYILMNLDEKKFQDEKNYENDFLRDLSTKMASDVVNEKGVVCTFFRLEAETYGPTRGIFLIGGYQKTYVSVRLTDLSKYSPTDTDHVGWYYLPIWNKSPVWTSPYDNENLRQKIISYSVPVYKNGKLLGVLGIDLSLAIIENIVHSLKIDNSTGLLFGKEQNHIHLYKKEEMSNSVERSVDIATMMEQFRKADSKKLTRFTWEGKKHFGILKQLDNGMTYITAITQDEAMQLINGQINSLIIIFLFVCLITSLLFFFLKRKIIIPFNILFKTTNRLARGELYVDIPYTSDNEIGTLTNNIRMMTTQMKEYIEYISEQTKKERAAKEAALTESQINAAASQAKSAFLANMSHEIRTPINAVLGMNEMILRESKDKAIIGYSSNIKIAGVNLLSIVNDILDFSKIEAGKMELIPDNYEVSSMIIDLLNMTRDRAKAKGLKFNLNVNSSLPKTLYGDSIRIKQCIINLLTNAIKYTKEGSVTFEIDFKKQDDDNILLKVNVKDTGCGIKTEDIDKLYKPFERIDEIKHRTIEGTGLGISIVNRLLDMMGSMLKVKTIYGKGSDFSFEIKQKVADWTAVGDINEAYEESVMEMADYKEKLHAPKAKLLFVDDTEMNLDVVKGLLKNTGITVDTALSGKQALEAIKTTKYDILFIDHRMPEMDGIETLHAMKEMSDNLCAGKPCIALTANAISGVKKMYLEEGFDDYLSKPVNPAKLEEMIRRYLPEDYIEAAPEEENETSVNTENTTETSEVIRTLSNIEGFDISEAIRFTGSEEVLLSTIKQYYTSMDQKAQELQQYFEAEDWKNYEIKVHALKSTSRLIGAKELSKLAEHLEKCANNNTVSEIQEKHKPLFDLFLSYKEKLAPLVKEEKNQTPAKEISQEELSEKIKFLLDYANDFDIDGLDSLISELSSVQLPFDFSQKFDKIKTSVENVDFKELRNLLSEWSNNK